MMSPVHLRCGTGCSVWRSRLSPSAAVGRNQIGGSLRPPGLQRFNTEVTAILRALRVEGLMVTALHGAAIFRLLSAGSQRVRGTLSDQADHALNPARAWSTLICSLSWSLPLRRQR